MYFFYFYPVGITRQRSRQPVLSWLLMVFMLVAFIWYRYFPDLFSLQPRTLVFYPGNGRIWTVATAIFLHAGWFHLLGNMIYFNVFGPILESRVGHLAFLMYFLMLGVFGNLVHGLVASQGWFGQYGLGVLGASGAIAGLLAFSMIRFHDARVEVAWWVFAPLLGQNRVGRSQVPMMVAVGLWIILQGVQALVASQTGSTVSFGAHFGGFFMGLVLALAMGQWQEGHLEGLRLKGAAYFRQGAYFAAAGMLSEYLATVPGDDAAWLELARAQILTRQLAKAGKNYRRVVERKLRQGEIPGALEAFQEADRAGLAQGFGPEILARVAYYQEKQLDHRGAIRTHEQIVAAYCDHSEGQRSLVRLVMLYRGKQKDPGAAAHALDRARKLLHEPGWQRFLDEEFRPEAGPDAAREPSPQQDFLLPEV